MHPGFFAEFGYRERGDRRCFAPALGHLETAVVHGVLAGKEQPAEVGYRTWPIFQFPLFRNFLVFGIRLVFLDCKQAPAG